MGVSIPMCAPMDCPKMTVLNGETAPTLGKYNILYSACANCADLERNFCTYTTVTTFTPLPHVCAANNCTLTERTCPLALMSVLVLTDGPAHECPSKFSSYRMLLETSNPTYPRSCHDIKATVRARTRMRTLMMIMMIATAMTTMAPQIQ